MDLKDIKPPRWANQLLEWFCSSEVLETIQGDLHELYGQRKAKHGRIKADLYFIKDVFSVFRPFAFKKHKSSNPTFFTMLQQTLLFTFRNFKRYKLSFFINLIGLSAGLSCTLMIYLWVNDELQVDRFYENDKRLFQVMQNIHNNNAIETTENTPGPLAKALIEEIPEVEYAVTVIPTIYNSSKGIISLEDIRIRSRAQYVTQDFFNTFSHKLIRGDKNQVLTNKDAVVISKELAITLFGGLDNVIGKMVEWNARDLSTRCFISGIFESPPSNATNQFDLLLSFEFFSENRQWVEKWEHNGPRT